MIVDEFVKGIETAAEAVVTEGKKAGPQSAVWGSIVINYVAGLSANLLWGGINALSLITSTALLKITIPTTAMPLFNFLKDMTKFDMFYDIYNPVEKMNFTET